MSLPIVFEANKTTVEKDGQCSASGAVHSWPFNRSSLEESRHGLQ